MKFGLRLLGIVAVLLAALVLVKFRSARRQSQEKAVIGNLQGLAAAAEQYFRENQVTGVSYHELVGPGRYVRNVYPVAGETYDHLFFVKGEPVRVRLPG